MDNLKYWTDRWIEVGKEYILNKNEEYENIKLWDNSSKTYDETVDSSRTSIIYKLEEEGYINEDSIVLDLGCGTGTNSIVLSEICKEVHALDYSDGMLDVLKEKIRVNDISNIKVMKKDYNTLDIEKEKMYKKYDFVICSLNPGCYNPESLLRLNELSKSKCCYIATDGKGKNKILDKADKYVLKEKIKSCDISNVIYPFNILYFSDYNPRMLYHSCVWNNRYSYEGAMKKLVDRYKSYVDVDDKIRAKIDEFVRDNMEEEYLEDKSENTLGIILWDVNR